MNLAIVPGDAVPIQGTGLIRLGAVPPRRMRYESNGIFAADSFEVELDETLFPLDVRDVRAVAVDLHLGDAGAIDAQIDTVSDRNRMILGQTDEVAKNINPDSASTVMLQGRDYAGLLLDEKWQGRALELGRPLSELVAEVVESIPAVDRMEVVLAEPDFDPIVPKGRGRKRSRYTAQPDKSVWEALVELGMKVGAIVTIDRDNIVVQPPRNVLAAEAQSVTPLFVEGRNLKNLSIKRTLGKPDVPNVLVQSIDPATGAIVEGRFPTSFREVVRATRIKERAKKVTNVEFRRFVVRHPAPTTQALNAVAKQIYDFHAREQIEISFDTMDMAVTPNPIPSDIEQRLALRTDPTSSPTTQLRNGSALRIRVEPDTRNVLEKAISPADKARELRQIGYANQVAAILSRGYRLFDELFFVDKASHEYDTASGYKLSVMAMNFIQVDGR